MNRAVQTKLPVLVLALLVCSCASLRTQPPDSSINTLLKDRGGPDVNWSNIVTTDKADIDQWLAAPLDADGAVSIAMLRSPELQQEYARLGLAKADVLEAVQIGNPGISLLRQDASPGGGVQRTLGFSLPLADLLLLPSRTRLARADFERARFDIANAVFDVALDVESAWYAYVGAQQVSEMRDAVANASNVSAALAERFYAAGNISELQLNQEYAAASEARIDAGRAKVAAAEKRLALNNLMGLDSDESKWTALDRLPLPVQKEDDAGDLIELAREKNLRLLAARQQLLVMQASNKSTRRWRWLGATGVGYEREKEADGSRLSGPSLNLELPIFNQGQAKLSRSEAMLADARARLREAELSIENTIRANANAVKVHGEAVGIFRNSLIPQREKVLAGKQQEQNFMLIGVFELIQAKAKEYDAYQGYLEAVRDYWLSRIELTRSVGERLPSDAGALEKTPGVQDILMPKNEMKGMDHSKHDMSKMGEMEPMNHDNHDMPGMKSNPDNDKRSETDAAEKTANETENPNENKAVEEPATDEHQHHGVSL